MTGNTKPTPHVKMNHKIGTIFQSMSSNIAPLLYFSFNANADIKSIEMTGGQSKL